MSLRVGRILQYFTSHMSIIDAAMFIRDVILQGLFIVCYRVGYKCTRGCTVLILNAL